MTLNYQRGEACHLAKLNPEKVRYVLSQTGVKNASLAAELGVHESSIRDYTLYAISKGSVERGGWQTINPKLWKSFRPGQRLSRNPKELFLLRSSNTTRGTVKLDRLGRL